MRPWRDDPVIRARADVVALVHLRALEANTAALTYSATQSANLTQLARLLRLPTIGSLYPDVCAELRARGMEPISRRTMYADWDRWCALGIEDRNRHALRRSLHAALVAASPPEPTPGRPRRVRPRVGALQRRRRGKVTG